MMRFIAIVMKQKVSTLGFFALFGLLFLVPLVNAQQGNPEFLITWSAESYVPPGFQGKILPTTTSPVIVSFELIENGRILDISSETVYWYLDDKLIRNGNGLKTISFRANAPAGGVIDIRIQMNNFKNQGKIMIKTITIPIANPEAVIEAPFPGNSFRDVNVKVVGRPFFFSVASISDLSFVWKVNGKEPTNTDDSSTLDVNVSGTPAAGTELRMSLTIQHPTKIFESAAKFLTLRFNQ